jgi:large subunit ribosomal protein L25
MRRLELEVKKREITGKKVRFLRRGGLVPCNIYGHGVDSTAVQVDQRKLDYILARAGGTDLISLLTGDSASPTRVIIREVQRNPMTGTPIHVDFYQVSMTEKLKAEVPLVFVGEAPALKYKNVTLMHMLTSLQIEALPDDLPHNIEVDVSTLAEIDQSIHVSNLKIGDKVTLLTDPEQMIIKVVEARKPVEEVPVAAPEAAEAEVEGEKAEEEAETAKEEK